MKHTRLKMGPRQIQTVKSYMIAKTLHLTTKTNPATSTNQKLLNCHLMNPTHLFQEAEIRQNNLFTHTLRHKWVTGPQTWTH